MNILVELMEKGPDEPDELDSEGISAMPERPPSHVPQTVTYQHAWRCF